MNLVFSLETIGQLAARIWASYAGATVFAFHGEMGAGKTTLVHALCETRGVKDVVGSPTFSIINEYETLQKEVKIFHIDLYRLKNEEEAIQAGVEDCLYSDHLCLVEWPERAPRIFPPGTVHVYLEVVDSDQRRLRIDGN